MTDLNRLINELTVESRNGLYVAHFDSDKMYGWGVGDINRGMPDFSEQELIAFATNVLDCIQPVSDEERAYSDCTDGRGRDKLANGLPVPVREKVVGADTVMAFQMAEAVGSSFYYDPNAPVEVRLEEVVDHLVGGGYYGVYSQRLWRGWQLHDYCWKCRKVCGNATVR